MELYPAELKKLQTLLTEWFNHPEQELEASFGLGGQVDATTFLAIAQRLRAKGYESLPQDDRLSVLTPQKVRLSLQGLGVIQNYCRDDKLEGKPFTAMIKDRTGLESNVDLDEYEMRVKSRREIPLADGDHRVKEILSNWTQQQKAFRLIKRWTFKGKGIRIDMSSVRSTAVDSRREYKWVRSFLEQNIFKSSPFYEVEVELVRGPDTDTPEKALTCLVRGVGEILRAIQKNTLLIRKSVRDKVIAAYTEMNGSNRFRGVSPVTLEVKNMTAELEEKVPNIRTGYNVTDKADGLRALGYCNKDGELYLIDMALNIYRTGLKALACRNSLVDGEWVTRDKEDKAINYFLIFDIYKGIEGEDVSQLPFQILDDPKQDCRYKRLQAWIKGWEESQEVLLKEITEITRLRVFLKTFIFARPGHVEIFRACADALDTPRIYHTDGLILTPNLTTLPAKSGETFFEQFKWKPAKDNSVDFLVTFEKDAETNSIDQITIGTHPDTGNTVRYKTLRLFVGASKEPAYDDPRATILNELPLPMGKSKAAYQPILFNPIDFPDTMASICYREIKVDKETGDEYVTTEDSDEPINHRSIIEMRYDPIASPGWRWIPMRVRHDKTERLLRGQITRTLNSEKVALSVWNSINNPVTVSMIRTGAEEPSEEEMKEYERKEEEEIVGRRYYERKAQKQDLALVRGLRDFHNKWIKDILLYRSVMKGGNKKVLDFAVGKAGDLQRWRREKALFVLGLDKAGDNIRDPANGAYRRYMDTLIQAGSQQVPRMVFAIGDSSLPIISGEAGATPEEADILRALFGQVQVQGALPKDINSLAGVMRSGADVAVCMFALHYFFENKDTLDSFMKNVRECVKVGGYFAGCCFDGRLVFNKLSGLKKGQSAVGKEEDVPIWSISKEYDELELDADDTSIGLPIDVEFISIGSKHREYLVNFEYLKKRMHDIGFELLTEDECREVGLRQSTNTFDESYRMAVAAKKSFPMSDTVKEFSFLNRWFIFKRVGESSVPDLGTIAEEQRVLSEAAAAAAAEENTTSMAAPAAAAASESAAAKAVESAVATAAGAPAMKTSFTAGEIINFYTDAANSKDVLGIGNKNYARWLAPTALFTIYDKTDVSEKHPQGTPYPSTNTYIAAMMLKDGAGRVDLARNLFSVDGSIHNDAIAPYRGKALSEVDKYTITVTEATAIAKVIAGPYLKRTYKISIDEAKWDAVKNGHFEEALSQRWSTDAEFRKIVTKAREMGKYLLYYSKGASDLGGHRSAADGHIEGNNKIGKIIMRLAGFTGFDLDY